MIGFDEPFGLLALAVIPLLVLWDRRRRRVTPVVFPLLSVLSLPVALDPERVPVFLRLNRGQRLWLRVVVVTLLAAVVAGTHWNSAVPPTEHLVVLIDNVAVANHRVRGTSLMDQMTAQVLALAKRRVQARIDVWATAPQLEFVAGAAPGRPLASDALGELTGWGSADVFSLVTAMNRMLAGVAPDRLLVVSPRPELWRARLADIPTSFDVRVAPGHPVQVGNSGIVTFRLAPSSAAESGHDLTFLIESVAADPSPRGVELRNAGRVAWRGQVAPGAEETVPGLTLEAGPVVLQLLDGDRFAADDRVQARLRSEAEASVAIHGPALPALEAAVAAAPGLRLVATPMADIDVFVGRGPGAVSRPTLLIRPVEESLGFHGLRPVAEPGALQANPIHPITRDLDFWSFRQEVWLDAEVPAGHRVLARAGEVPLITVGDEDGYRVVVWNFDPFAEGLTGDPSIPVLTRQSLVWLAGGEGASWHPGAACPGGTGRGGQGALDLPANVLCAPVTTDAAYLAVPGLLDQLAPTPPATETSRADLATPALLLALGLIAFGAFVNLYPPPARPN